jgi:hypothetical protein
MMLGESSKYSKAILIFLLLAAVLVRMPGIFWGYNFFTEGPFVFQSYDEEDLCQLVLRYFETGELGRRDYLYGLGRELQQAFALVRPFHEISSASDIVVIARGMNVIYGAATVLLTVFCCYCLFGNCSLAIVSGLFLAFCPLHVMNSHYGTPTISVVFWSYLSFLCCLLYKRSEDWPFFIIAAAAAAIAVAVKFNLICFVPLLYIIFTVRGRWFWKVFGLLCAGAVFLYYNFGVFPEDLFTFRFLLADNFWERQHDLWVNPIAFVINLIPGMGLAAFSSLLFGLWQIKQKALYVFTHIPRLGSRFFCFDLPLIVYFVVICSMTSAFPRHLVMLTPYLCMVSAFGVLSVYNLLCRHRLQLLGALVCIFIAAYQVMAVLWVEQHHIESRALVAAQWISSNLPEQSKIYIPSDVFRSLVWKDLVPKQIQATSSKEADYLLISERLIWRYKRSTLTPFSASPAISEVYHNHVIEDPPLVRSIIKGNDSFERIALFPATEILPEFILYQKIFHTFNRLYGDISIYRRKVS